MHMRKDTINTIVVSILKASRCRSIEIGGARIPPSNSKTTTVVHVHNSVCSSVGVRPITKRSRQNIIRYIEMKLNGPLTVHDNIMIKFIVKPDCENCVEGNRPAPIWYRRTAVTKGTLLVLMLPHDEAEF